jgi:hypothetical protein
MPCVFGCVTSFLVPLPVTVAISLLWPEEFDWGVFATEITRVRAEHGTALHDQEERESYFTPERVKYMKRMSRWAAGWAVATILGHVLLWPLPMFGAKMTFSKSVSSCLFTSFSRCSVLTKTVFHCMDRYFPHLALVHTSCVELLPAHRRRG